MTVSGYRSQPYETTHENRAFDALLGVLEAEWGKSDDPVVLLGNLYCRGSELDAAIIRRKSITVLDFKDYGGKIDYSENGKWFADDVEVKGGNKRNPYHQIRTNKFALLEFIKDLGGLPSGRSLSLGHISGMVLFQRPITFDENQIIGPISRWLHVVDMEHATLRISQLTSHEIDLTNDDIDAIVHSTGLSEYRPAGAGVQLKTKTSDDDFDPTQELQEELREGWLQLADFLSGQNSVAIVAGMIGTGKRDLLKVLVGQAELTGRNVTVLCPNKRLAVRCAVEAKSVYSHIYSGNPHLHKRQFVYDRLGNQDDPRHLYLIDDAHLISDSLFDTGVLRFGSGQLLTDLIGYLEIDDPGRQIVFLGDPYQLGRGNFEECALSKSRIAALIGHGPLEVELDCILARNKDSIFTKNCIALANRIRLGRFNELEILTNEESCVEAPTKNQENKALFEGVTPPKFVAFSNAHVNKFNDWVRRAIYRREGRLISGDIVQIHNGFSIHDDQVLERPYLVQNNCFAEILEVADEPEVLSQELRGRENPVEISFLKVRARFQHDGAVKDFLCLRDYLLSEKPEIDPETLLALWVSATARFKRKYGGQLDAGATNSDEKEFPEGPEGLEADILAAFMIRDRYLNAARMRFGYGLTLHRAQGQKYPEVVANLDTGQGQTNESYFRWLYTLFTIPDKRLHLVNIPKLSPFVEARWDEARSQLNKVEPDEAIRYDPSAGSPDANALGFDFPAPELAALHHHVASLLSGVGLTVTGVEHHQYQEIYEIQESEQVHCRIRLHYKKGFKISQISIVDPSESNVGDRVRKALKPDITFDDEFQECICEEVRSRLTPNSIEVRVVEHGSYKEIYFLGCSDGEAKVEINYNKDGFVTVVALSAYSDPRMKLRVRQGLGF